MERDFLSRKSTRLESYNYSSDGYNFVTTCTNGRCHLFGNVVGSIGESTQRPVMELNNNGYIVKSFIEYIPIKYSNVHVDCYVIMPNHIHFILRICHGSDWCAASGERAIRESPLQQRRGMLLSKIVGYVKMNTSKQIRLNHSDVVVWQRGYHEHVIRNEQKLQIIREYIANNPAVWQEDMYYK